MIGYIIVSLSCILILHCICKTINWVWFKPRKLEKQLRQQGLVGNSYKLFYGDHKESSKMRIQVKEKSMPFTNDYFGRVFPYFDQLAKKYGENCFSWVGPTPFIHITDSNLINDAISRIYEFQKIEATPLVNSLFCGLVSYEGERWEMHRKLLNPALQLQKVKFMLPTFCTSINELVNKWDKLLLTASSCEIDVFPYFTTMSADAITRTSFGSTYEDERRVFQLITEQQEVLAPLINSIYIPGWMYIPTKRNKRIKDKNALIESLMKKLIDKKERAMKEGSGSSDDLLGTLIASSKKREGNNYIINYQELLNDCKLFFFSGHETTSTLLAWTILLLSKHQDWQTRAREEILATFGMNPPDYDGLHRLKIGELLDESFVGNTKHVKSNVKKLNNSQRLEVEETVLREIITKNAQKSATINCQKFNHNDSSVLIVHLLGVLLGQMKMILNEVLRLYPPIPTLTRVIRAGDTTLGNLYIPKGTIVNLSVIHAHHNPKYWGNDAKEFNPERFSGGIGKATNGNMSFFPFGGGPRICIGQNLALVESKMALSIILQRFAFELSPSYVHAPTSVITLKPQHGAHVIINHV